MSNVEHLKVSMTKTDVLNETKDPDKWNNGATVLIALEKLEKGDYSRTKDAEKGVVPPDTMGLKFQARFAIIDPRDGRTVIRPAVFQFIGLPLRHPEHDCEPPTWASGSNSNWNQMVRALLADKGFAPPKMVDGQLTYNGKAIKEEDKEAAKLDLADKTSNLLMSLWNENPDQINGKMCIGSIKHSGDFVNVQNFKPITEQTKQKLTPYDELKGDVTGTAGGGNGKTGAATPAKPKVKGKGKKRS